MALDAMRKDLVVGVVGAGAMGRGIAQVAAVGGCIVKLYDAKEDAAKEAQIFIQKMLNRNAEKGRMAQEDAEDAAARIEVVSSMSEFRESHCVIEAVVESLDVKRAVFKELESIVSSDCVIATNTSSLSVSTIAAACEKPSRVAGLHFFNPVPLMKLVEVIDGILTDPKVADFLMVLGRRLGRESVRVKDAPGFLVNQVGRGYNIEAAHIAMDGIADIEDIDRILRDAVGFRMGPFQLLDLTALDVTHPATELIYKQFYHEPRFRPATMLQMRLDAGLLGSKVGRGFYSYDEGKVQLVEEGIVPEYDGRAVWISKVIPEFFEKIRLIVENAGAPIDKGDIPDDESLILVTPLGDDATTASTDQGLDPNRTIAVDCLFGLEKRRTLMKTTITDPIFTASAHGLFGGGKVPATVIHDTPGFIAQRVVAAICNIGCSVAQQRTAAPEDIDKAVKLGLNYPKGPLEFGDFVGADKIVTILKNIYKLTGDPRYRLVPWLRRRAQLGVSLLTQEN
ncbi:MAG: 3-hydroxyacyl-CoA dehydrogenase [Magnetovibrio sp.]|nr:3-hydroxyacyl-CoA dehydrogenase [Magnetovibrio sp.]